MKEFLIFFYVLDQCYVQCKEYDLGGFLGAISPELWGDGLPADKAILGDWREHSRLRAAEGDGIISRAYSFLRYCEQEYGYHFSETKEWLLTKADDVIIKRAYDAADLMCRKYHYDN